MFLSSLNIAGSGMTAQRLCMDVISENLANQDTTVTAAGGPYRRKVAVLQEVPQPTFGQALDAAQSPGGVEVKQVVEDNSAFKLSYDPENPAAGADGYVRLPNVDTTTEMVNLVQSSRSYEADVTAFNAIKDLALSALDIGK